MSLSSFVTQNASRHIIITSTVIIVLLFLRLLSVYYAQPIQFIVSFTRPRCLVRFCIIIAFCEDVDGVYDIDAYTFIAHDIFRNILKGLL